MYVLTWIMLYIPIYVEMYLLYCIIDPVSMGKYGYERLS